MPTPLDALAGTVNASQPIPNLVTSGQPSAETFQALRSAGVEVVIDIRDPMEPRPFDQPSLMTELGFQYVNIPVNAGTMTRATLEQILSAVRNAGARPTLVHCASGNRVGGALYPYLIQDHGFTEEEAMTAALRMGLRSAEVLEWGKGYVEGR